MNEKLDPAIAAVLARGSPEAPTREGNPLRRSSLRRRDRHDPVGPPPVAIGNAAVLAPWFMAAMVCLWTATVAALGTAQWADNIEQFVWAHGYEWGYPKHPPLPTWLLATSIDLFGASPWSAIVLAGVCTAATGSFTYATARRLIGQPAAVLALLLWGLQQPYSNRASLFNHNTVLMLTVAMTAWSALRALAAERSLGWWLLCGLCAGAALLAKYQALVPLAGIAAAIALTGRLASRRVRWGLVLAAVTALVLTAPHVQWVLGHDFSTLDYATEQSRTLALPERGATVVSFVAQQLRFVFPALLLAVLVALLDRSRGSPVGDPSSAATTTELRAWLIGLVAVPIVLTVLADPLLGLKLQNHWGFQSLQFASLWLAHALRRRTRVRVGFWFVLAMLVHAIFLAVTVDAGRSTAPEFERRPEARFPARELAAAVARDWSEVTSCPMRVVVGPTFEAGVVSVYNGGTAKVLEGGDFRRSPWVSADDIERYGAVYIAIDPAQLPGARATRVGSLALAHRPADAAQRIHWAIIAPERCDPGMRR